MILFATATMTIATFIKVANNNAQKVSLVDCNN